jgi:hypothetical protein
MHEQLIWGMIMFASWKDRQPHAARPIWGLTVAGAVREDLSSTLPFGLPCKSDHNRLGTLCSRICGT